MAPTIKQKWRQLYLAYHGVFSWIIKKWYWKLTHKCWWIGFWTNQPLLGTSHHKCSSFTPLPLTSHISNAFTHSGKPTLWQIHSPNTAIKSPVPNYTSPASKFQKRQQLIFSRTRQAWQVSEERKWKELRNPLDLLNNMVDLWRSLNSKWSFLVIYQSSSHRLSLFKL